MCREYTPDEVRDELIRTMRHRIRHSLTYSDPNDKAAQTSAVLHAVLCIFDGVTGLPAFDLVVKPHPDDRAYHINSDENWYPENVVINGNQHLHDLI